MQLFSSSLAHGQRMKSDMEWDSHGPHWALELVCSGWCR